MNIIVKLSGEFINDRELLSSFATSIQGLLEKGHRVGLVIGGGNLVRGRDFTDNRLEADRLGLYSTLINGLLLKTYFKNARLLSSFETALVEKINHEALKEKLLIFAGGVGVPYLSTDTAAIFRAIDIKADLVLKATKVDGVYDSDPRENSSAKLYRSLSYDEILSKKLGIIDATAAAMARAHKIKMIIFNGRNGKIEDAIEQKIGTIIEG